MTTLKSRRKSGLDDLHDQAVAMLRQYRRASDDLKTPILRDLAEVLVEARGHFLRGDGTPDWKGRTYNYRQWVSEVYFAAGFNKTEAAKVQAAVRYHVGTVLREQLDEETLRDYGLVSKTPKERSAEGRRGRAAYVSALTSNEIRGGAGLALAAALNVLAKVDREDLADADDSEREVIEAVLASLERQAHSLRNAVAHADKVKHS